MKVAMAKFASYYARQGRIDSGLHKKKIRKGLEPTAQYSVHTGGQDGI